MNLDKSIDFLRDKAGAVIQYLLRKEILCDLTSAEEEDYLERIYGTPFFKLVQSYAKPNGYIGSGMHSWDNWRGVVLHETPLQDGETAARLLSYYAVPKAHPLVAGFVAAMRDEAVLREEFSYIPPEIPRFENRFIGLNSGNCLMGLAYTMQAMLGYGDDYADLRAFQETALEGFRRLLPLSSLEDCTKTRPNSKAKYNYPYIEAEDYFPNAYTLAMLAYTQSWRTAENVRLMADALNHINRIMKHDNNMHIRIDGRYYAPSGALCRPLRAFRTNLIDSILYRRPLTEMAMLGVGRAAAVVHESAENVVDALREDGVLRMDWKTPHNKGYSPKKLMYPTAYCDVKLEEDKSATAVECDLTFWAVQFLSLVDGTEGKHEAHCAV